MATVIGLLVIAALGVALFAPSVVPRALRGLGSILRTAGQATDELTGASEVEDGPIARIEARAGEIIATRIERQHAPAPADVRSRVKAIGARRASEAERRGVAFRFHGIEDSSPSAWALPGGAIFISRALVDLCGSDDDRLAGVLAHEIAHIDLRHALKRLAKQAATRVGTTILLRRFTLLGRVASELETIPVRGYEREHELEADLHGALLARKAGFDPRGLAALLGDLEMLEEAEGREPLPSVAAYFSSHPPFAVRRRALEQRFPPKR